LNKLELQNIATETISISKSGKYLTTSGQVPIDISDAVAKCFHKVLFDDGLITYYDRVMFAIPDENSENYRAFRKGLVLQASI